MNPSDENNNRMPPCSLEAERAVLGACMLDMQAANAVRQHLESTDFYSPHHQIIYECIQKMVDLGEPCDPVLVGDSLRTAGDLERVGGMAYLLGLLDAVPAPSAAVHYASIVSDKALIRALLSLADSLSASGYGSGQDGKELLEMAEKKIFEVSQGRLHGDFQPLSAIVMKVYDQISTMKEESGVTGIPTFHDLDTKYLSGLHKSDLIILAARPGTGKTAMALNIAQNAAAKHGKTVALFSLEMPKEQLVQRMLCSEAKVDNGLCRKGRISREDIGRLKNAVASLSAAPVYIDDTMSVSVGEMRSKCRKLKTEHGLDLVVVDYIQLMHAGGGNRHPENRQLEVAEISRGLKAMAKELDVPVLALSQLSRLADQSKEAPNLSHLRESGALEQDADVVIMLHANKDQNPKDEEGNDLNEEETAKLKLNQDSIIVQVHVAKHRNGPTGAVDMVFVRPFTLYRDCVENWLGNDDVPPPSSHEYFEPDVF